MLSLIRKQFHVMSIGGPCHSRIALLLLLVVSEFLGASARGRLAERRQVSPEFAPRLRDASSQSNLTNALLEANASGEAVEDTHLKDALVVTQNSSAGSTSVGSGRVLSLHQLSANVSIQASAAASAAANASQRAREAWQASSQLELTDSIAEAARLELGGAANGTAGLTNRRQGRGCNDAGSSEEEGFADVWAAWLSSMAEAVLSGGSVAAGEERPKAAGVGICLADANKSRLGCKSGSCKCRWFESCFTKFRHHDVDLGLVSGRLEDSSDNVGMCDFSVPAMIFLALLLIACTLELMLITRYIAHKLDDRGLVEATLKQARAKTKQARYARRNLDRWEGSAMPFRAITTS